MRLYLERNRSNVRAVAEYDENAGTFTVLKGSTVSDTIAYTEKFRGAKSIEKSRTGTVSDGKVIKDVVFKSSSTAANFVTGSSTNGLTAWKNDKGVTLKSLLSKENTDE